MHAHELEWIAGARILLRSVCTSMVREAGVYAMLHFQRKLDFVRTDCARELPRTCHARKPRTSQTVSTPCPRAGLFLFLLMPHGMLTAVGHAMQLGVESISEGAIYEPFYSYF